MYCLGRILTQSVLRCVYTQEKVGMMLRVKRLYLEITIHTVLIELYVAYPL
jgi:hypothetical protein